MTPKEKATEILYKYRTIMFPIIDNKQVYHGESLFSDDMAKQCALITAKQIADECNECFYPFGGNRVNYWCAVIAEIEKL